MESVPEGAAGEYGHFGRPLLSSPKSRRLSRVGVVDIGSNSIRLVVFDGAARSPAYFYNEKVMCGLGAGLAETGRLNAEGRERALAALARFQALGAGYGITPLTAVATAAMRDAEDGPAFREEIRRRTGIEPFVVEGRDEARLAAQGVLLGWPSASGLVCDIGGSSMELAALHDGEVGECETSPLGPLKLLATPMGKGALRKHIDAEVEKLAERFTVKKPRLFLVGGSWRAIAKIDMARRGYPLKVLHEYRLGRKGLAETLKWTQKTDIETLRQQTGISANRMALIPMASRVLEGVLRRLKPREVYISGYGLREGLLWEQMPDDLRARDPLIEACRHAEAKDARVPGFGRVLYRFVRPLFPEIAPERIRLIKAACLLHDVSWRAHPDYRPEVCFEYATRANLGGMSHSERVFLGLALLHRYKNSRIESFSNLLSLLEPEQLREAEILGKAMRFGSMFSAQRSDSMGKLKLDPKAGTLLLLLDADSAAFFGEVAQARFASLAKALEVSGEVQTKPGQGSENTASLAVTP